jgi:hypothetical protein
MGVDLWRKIKKEMLENGEDTEECRKEVNERIEKVERNK